MMKPGVPVFVVDSVEKAVKFYTEKLGFDIVELRIDPEARHILSYAQVRKRKCFIIFRAPLVDELAEFSLIKRCSSRGVGVYVLMKKGLDEYLERCKKKRVEMISEVTTQPWGDRTFTIRDPFGIRLMFAEQAIGFQPPSKRTFLDMEVNQADDATREEMIRGLRGFKT